MQLVIDQGAASLQTMPYNPNDYQSQPSAAARSEAANFKADSFARLNGMQQIKAALANRQPVVGGMMIYDSFNYLTGNNPVYNTFTGQEQGGHAITFVGYDDNRYGGAFKLINSWGVGWGDQGYFWLPYQHFGNVMMQAWVLTDKSNTNTNPNQPDIPVVPPTTNNLPNLQVADWNVQYDPKPGGTGSWTWEVTNTGTADAPAGADVNLILSADNNLDSSDLYIVYETLPSTLKPGESLVRSSTNPRSFVIPTNISPGTYYMATRVQPLPRELTGMSIWY
jgi:hypothetical protein